MLIDIVNMCSRGGAEITPAASGVIRTQGRSFGERVVCDAKPAAVILSFKNFNARHNTMHLPRSLNNAFCTASPLGVMRQPN